jgi:hypothetical protein
LETNVFHIEFFTDDRFVTAIMRLLAGKTHNLKVEPVVGVQKTSSGLKSTTPDGKIIDLLAAHLAKNNIEKINGREMSRFLEGIGRAPGSTPYLAKEGIKAHLLRKVGAGLGSYYQVMMPKILNKKPKAKLAKPKSKAKAKSKSKPKAKPKAEQPAAAE